jgi:hypothetical protein
MPDKNKPFTPPESDFDGEKSFTPPEFLTPQGTAQPNPSGPRQPGALTAQDILGTGANIANNTMAGAGLGGLFGPPGAIAGGAIGALGSLFQKPSETPGMDAGALAGSLAASAIPGGRIARMLGQTAGVVGGALAGSQADKALGFTKDTDLGKVGIYGAGATLSGILGSLASEASPTAQAAQRLQANTGVDYPLSTTEQTGRFGGLSNLFMRGSQSAQDLSAAQSDAARSAIEKITNTPLDTHVQAIADATKYQRDIRKDIVAGFARNYKQANAQTVTSQTPSSVLGPNGQPIMNTTSKTVFPKQVNWDAFQKMYGLSDQERDMFFRAIRVNPEQFVNQLAPTTSENPMKGLLKLRGIMDVMRISGRSTEAANLGQAVVMRDLAPALEGDVVNGAQLADRIDNASEHFKIIFGQKQRDALEDLATVARNATPLDKALGQSQAEHSAGYLMNKILFGAASMGAVGAAGAHGMGNDAAATWLLGTAGGATIALSTSTLVGKVLANPGLGKLLISASKGDQKAMSAAFRSLVSDRYATSDNPDAQTPASRLAGLFGK